MHSHPLIEIHFTRIDPDHPEHIHADLEKTVHWYHVPRLGDEVQIGNDDFGGVVQEVIWWEADGIVAIRLG